MYDINYDIRLKLGCLKGLIKVQYRYIYIYRKDLKIIMVLYNSD